MTQFQQTRDEFIEASCPTSAPQAQIQDMQMAFDAGAVVVLQMILGFSDLPEDEGENKLSELSQELTVNARFHVGE